MSIIYKFRKNKGKDFLQDIRGKKGCFLCSIAHTETSSVPGISAAGASRELIKYTPAADVEAIYYGRAKCLPAVPENPKGPPSPVIISIASLQILNIPFLAINAGVKVKPFAPLVEINDVPGGMIDSGEALFALDFTAIKEKCEILASELSKCFDYIVLGESVPGGTTTAMALINGLGYNSFNKICGSMPGNQHKLKIQLVKKALEHLLPQDSPLDIVRKVGDPMQPAQAVLGSELSKKGVKVLLAGGTQMVAVAALIKHIDLSAVKSGNLAIATTKWVSEDKDSDIKGLMEEIGLDIPLMSSNLDFSVSKYENLQLYEQGFVKEGVGAGALAVSVFNEKDISNEEFLLKIESIYEKIYQK
jgi:uncharacterized protein (TIGR00303 family)